MADFYIGEIRAFPYTYAPDGWLPCNGQSVSISQYNALYAIIGNTYGSPPNQQSFILPNLNGANGQVGIPMLGVGQGLGLTNYALGQKTGVQTVNLNTANMPSHSHTITAINADPPPSTYPLPTTSSHLSRLENSTGVTDYAYSDQTPTSTLAPSTMGMSVGNSQSHDNNQPYLAVIYAIAHTGDFPTSP
jgi:microcystin-dependent protein